MTIVIVVIVIIIRIIEKSRRETTFLRKDDEFTSGTVTDQQLQMSIKRSECWKHGSDNHSFTCKVLKVYKLMVRKQTERKKEDQKEKKG